MILFLILLLLAAAGVRLYATENNSTHDVTLWQWHWAAVPRPPTGRVAAWATVFGLSSPEGSGRGPDADPAESSSGRTGPGRRGPVGVIALPGLTASPPCQLN